MIKHLIFLCYFLFNTSVYSKVMIFTYAYKWPDFIEIQHKTFTKFLVDEYEFIVFNDARNHDMESTINSMCEQYHIRCIRIPQEIHNRPYLQRWPGENYNHPTVRNCNVVQYSLDTLGFKHNDIVLLIDSDMFLVKRFCIRSFLEGYNLGGRLLGRGSRIDQGDIIYLWHGLTFLNMPTMPNKNTLNFNCGRVEGKPIDGGGHSYYYLKNNPSLKLIAIDHNFSDELQCNNCKGKQLAICTHNTDRLIKAGFDNLQIEFLQSVFTNGNSSVEYFLNNSFLHYRCGSNWNNQDSNYHLQKTNALLRYINKLLNL